MTLTLSPRPVGRDAQPRLTGEQVTTLIEAVTSGDEHAWSSLIQIFGPMIWSIALAHRLREADAADVTQATWLALVEHLAKLRDPARVGAWLATTARRECLRILRGKKRRVLYGDDCPEHESSSPGPAEVLLRSERDAALWRSFGRLRPTDQALLCMLMADPHPAYEDISAALDMPIGSIGPTRQRALARLRDQLALERALSLMYD
ncbi:MAG TPA: sigma-70 family RNA polymerase sigma factor [Solirubrobacteraceae bacterium]|jgi:RNA polymerase sigma factor (sigma-70 family)|nr:sigma-70 family RNA polymerase sigma factor [Solirubrobacteraceae bacterium]